MRGRRDTVAQLERELESTRTTLVDTDAERVRQTELAGDAEQEKRAAAQDPAVFVAANAKAVGHRLEAERLTLVLDDRRRALAELEVRLAVARHENHVGALEAALAQQHDASKEFAAILAAAGAASAALLAARDQVDSAMATARASCPPDMDFQAPRPDEPEWPEAERLVDVLEAGPRRPLAKSAAAVAKHDRERKAAEDSRMRQAVDRFVDRGEDFDRIQALPAEQLSAALRHAERRVKTERAAATDVFVERLERRLERVRELAASAVIGA